MPSTVAYSFSLTFYTALCLMSVSLLGMANPSQSKSTRLYVNTIELVGFQPYPKQGIERVAIEQLIHSWLDKLGPQLTLTQLHGISDEVTRFYREQGLMMARARIIPQEIEEGIVKMHISPGILGEVVVSGEQFMRPKTIARPFLSLLDQVVIDDHMQVALGQVEQLPGLDVFGYFSVGSQPGETRVNLKVLKEDPWPWQASLRSDNYGNSNTGEYRLIGQFSVENLNGFAERYQLGVLQTLAEDSTTLGYLNTAFPFFHPKTTLSWYLSNSQFSLGEEFEVLDIQGRGHETQISFNYQDLIKADQARSYHLHLGYFDNEVNSGLIGESINNTLETLTLGVSAQQNWNRAHQYHSLGARLTVGENDHFMVTPNSSQQDSHFHKIRFYYQGQWQLSASRHWLAKLTPQWIWSNDRLPGTHQTGLTGPYTNRAFISGDASADTAFLIQGQLSMPYANTRFKWLNQIRPMLFLDYANGTRNAGSNSSANSIDYSLASFGGGISYQHQGLIIEGYAGLSLQQKQTEAGETTNLYSDTPSQLYMALTYVWE